MWSTGWEASTAAKNLCRQQSSRAGARWPLAPHRLLGLRPNQRALQVVQLAVQSPKPTRDTDARGTARPAASTTQTVSCALVTAAPAPPACLSSKAAHNSRLAASQQRPAFGGSSSSSSLMQQQLTPVAARRIQVRACAGPQSKLSAEAAGTGAAASQWPCPTMPAARAPAPARTATHPRRRRRRCCLQSELNDWARNPPDGCCLESCEPMTHWTIVMSGPDPAAGMPRLYEGEVFRCAPLAADRAQAGARRCVQCATAVHAAGEAVSVGAA